MDKMSVIGIIVAFIFLIYGIFSGGSLLSFYDLPSIYIVFGGSIGIILLSSPFDQVKTFHKKLMIAFSNKKIDPIDAIKNIIDLSYIARREGLLALENKAEEIDDLFLKKGILLAVDGMESQIIRDVLGEEITAMEKRHKEGRNVFDVGSVMFPAFGMIGTLIGLINMLKDLSSVEKLGPQMSIALVTTFYGSVVSNLFFIPIAKKLSAKTAQEVLVREIIIEGVVSIQAGENTRFVEQKLMSYLSPKQRELLLGGKDDE